MDRDNNRGRRRQADEENEAYEERREKNRIAAQKCRQLKNKHLEEVKQKNKELEVENKQLSDEKSELKKQVKKNCGIIQIHIRKGCKIPEDMIAIWNQWSSEINGASSSDEDVTEADMPQTADFTEEIQAPSMPVSNTQETRPHQKNTILDDGGHPVEAPTALFSGKPLEAHQVTRRRSNSNSNLLPAPRVFSDQSPVMNVSSPKRNGHSSFLEPVSVLNTSAATSMCFPNDVDMQMKMTATPDRARNTTSNIMSNTFRKAENVPNMVKISHNLTHIQNRQAFSATEPRLGTGTRDHRFDNPSKPKENPVRQLTMEYQNGTETEERPLSNEDTNNGNFIPSSYVVEPVENYTYLEDIMTDGSSNERTENGNNGIQGPSGASSHAGSLFQGKTQSQPTVPFHTMAPALPSIAPEMSPSLRQQFKISLNSLPNQATQTTAGAGVVSKCQNVMTKPQAEVHISANTLQSPLDTLGVQPVMASRQFEPRSETTSSRDTQAAFDQSLSMPQEMFTCKATVLSPEQLFLFQQKQIAGRKQSLQKDVQHEESVTGTSTTHKATSVAGSNTSRDKYDDTFSVSKLGRNILHPALQSVTQTANPRTINRVVSNTVTLQSCSSSNSQLLHNTPSDPIKQHSFIQFTNGSSSHGHNRRQVTTTNDIYINTAAGNPPFQQQPATRISNANNINSGAITNVARANSVAYGSSPTRVNTISPQSRPLVIRTSSTNGHNPHANNADYTSTPVALNISAEPGDQYPSKMPTTSTSSGHQAINNKRMSLKATYFPQELQVPNAVNLYCRNTKASCSGTDIADQKLVTRSSEGLQPTNTLSHVYFLSQQRSPEACVDNLSILNTPTVTYNNNIISQFEDIDYLSESPQACASVQPVNTTESTTSANSSSGNGCQNIESPSFNIPTFI